MSSQETAPSPSLETKSSEATLVSDADSVSVASPDLADFERLQRRLIVSTLLVSAIAVPATALIYDLHIASSLLVGGLAGAFYLRLLARSVGKLGNAPRRSASCSSSSPLSLSWLGLVCPNLSCCRLCSVFCSTSQR